MGQHGGGVPGRGAERMTTKDLVLSIMRSQGAADALDLRSRAPDLDGTAIIAEEAKVPQFDGTKDYSGWAIGSPVWEEVNGERQVFTLLQPPNGTSGMYMSGECCVDGGVVYRCLTDNTVHSPTDYPQAWERV